MRNHPLVVFSGAILSGFTKFGKRGRREHFSQRNSFAPILPEKPEGFPVSLFGRLHEIYGIRGRKTFHGFTLSQKLFYDRGSVPPSTCAFSPFPEPVFFGEGIGKQAT